MHERNARGLGSLKMPRFLTDRADNQPFNLAREELFDGPLFGRGLFAGVGQQDGIAILFRGSGHFTGDGGEEGIRYIGYDDTEQAGLLRTQGLSRSARTKLQLLSRLLHGLFGPRTDAVLPCLPGQCARCSRHADPGGIGNLLQCGGRCGHGAFPETT